MKALEFDGRGGEYFRIWIVNVLLTIVTLSIYHPWAKVRTRRYFLGNTRLEGRQFDYHATGKQLLPAYLVALLLVVIYGVAQSVFPVASLVLAGVLLLALPWIIYRSLKFNLRNTSYSTVRFGFDGTAGGAYVTYMLWPILFVLCLAAGPLAGGILSKLDVAEPVMIGVGVGVVSLIGYILAFVLYAFIKKRQAHYMINGYRFGQGQFLTSVRTGGFAKILLKTIGLGLLMLVIVGLVVAGIAFATGIADDAMSLVDQLDDPDVVESMSAAFVPIIFVMYIVLLSGMFLIAAFAYTRQRTYILGNSALDGSIRFASTLRATRYAWVLVTNLLLIVVTLGLGSPWAKTRLARVVAENTLVDTDAGFDAYVTQKQSEQSSLGEQIGDAFDVDVGIGF